MSDIHAALVVYAAGIVIGLSVMRDPWPSRLLIALVWPLGPMAFVVVTSVMLVVAAILWPVPIVGTAAVLATVIYLAAC